MSNIAYFEEAFVPIDQAKISIKTHAFLYGTSVFEGLRAYWNPETKKLCVFRAAEHYARLKNSAKILRMDFDKTVEDLLKITQELLEKNNFQEDTYIRPIVYKADCKIGPVLLNNTDRLCMFAVPMGDYIDTQAAIKLSVSSWKRIDDNMIPARAKIAGSYVNTALAKTDAVLNGFADTIMLDDRGHVCEGSAMNLFLVKDDRLITSAITDNILEGITRDTIIQIAAKELGIETIERSIDRTELYFADEVFLCGTGAQISAAGSIDHYQIGTGQIGSITKKLQDIYFKLVRGEMPQYSNWVLTI